MFKIVKDITTKINVKIPQGIDNGDQIRVPGGGYSNDGQQGDLFVQVVVKEHPLFKRDRAHLMCQIPVDVVTAALGGEIEVPTLTGKVRLKFLQAPKQMRNFAYVEGYASSEKRRYNGRSTLYCACGNSC